MIFWRFGRYSFLWRIIIRSARVLIEECGYHRWDVEAGGLRDEGDIAPFNWVCDPSGSLI